MAIISIVNSKGGTGKTTTALFLWHELNQRGRKALLIDLDPSRNITTDLHIKSTAPTIYDVLEESTEPADAILKTEIGDVIPGSKQTANPELLAPINAYLLKSALDKITGYEFIILDTPPTPPDTSGIINNAFVCSDGVVIVTDPEKNGLQGTTDELEIIDRIKKYLNPQLTVKGILINKCRTGNPHHQRYINLVNATAREFNARVYKTVIREGIAVGRIEGDDNIIDALKKHKTANVVKDFTAFVDEFITEG